MRKEEEVNEVIKQNNVEINQQNQDYEVVLPNPEFGVYEHQMGQGQYYLYNGNENVQNYVNAIFDDRSYRYGFDNYQQNMENEDATYLPQAGPPILPYPESYIGTALTADSVIDSKKVSSDLKEKLDFVEDEIKKKELMEEEQKKELEHKMEEEEMSIEQLKQHANEIAALVGTLTNPDIRADIILQLEERIFNQLPMNLQNEGKR